MLTTVGASGGVWAPSAQGSLGLSITVQIRKGQGQREGQELRGASSSVDRRPAPACG